MIQFFIILFATIIVIGFTFVFWVLVTLLNQKSKPILSIGIPYASQDNIVSTTEHLRKLGLNKDYFVIIYLCKEEVCINVFGNENIDNINYQELKTLIENRIKQCE